MVSNWSNLNQIAFRWLQYLHVCGVCVGFVPINRFIFIHPWRCLLKDKYESPARQTRPDTQDRHKTCQYDSCKQAHLYCVCVFLPRSVSLYRQWISGVRTSFKLSHSINTGPIDFFKQLMEAFRAGKLIKIICRSSSFKDSPLVYVELNHAWLENPSIGHCNWLVFLMAFQCTCISEKVSEFLWRISCCNSNNPKCTISCR